jgi:AraC-like DNA-binding protein
LKILTSTSACRNPLRVGHPFGDPPGTGDWVNILPSPVDTEVRDLIGVESDMTIDDPRSADIDDVMAALIEADDLYTALAGLDDETRSCVRFDAYLHFSLVADDELNGAEGRFYQEIIGILESQAEGKPIQRVRGSRRAEVALEPMYRVPDVAQRIGMSEDWTRRYFEKVDGVKTIQSPPKRSKRPYSILLIPKSVLERELRKLGRA